MKRLSLSIAALLFVPCLHCQSATIGVALDRAAATPEKRVQIAKQLGANWYRPEPVRLGRSNPTCDDCDRAHAAGLKLVVVVRNSDSDKASGSVNDISKFRQRISELAAKYKPEVLVVEAEPDDKRSFAGTPQEFATELRVACEVAHSLDIKCAPGGISSRTFATFVASEMWKSDTLQAAGFAVGIELVRSHSREPFNIMGKKIGGGAKTPEQAAMEKATQKFLDEHNAEIERAREMLQAAAIAGADYVNFHWYELKPDYLPDVISVLNRLVHKPVMSDSVGQREDRAFTVSETLKQMIDTGVNPVIWDAVNGHDGNVGLVDKGGKIRAMGTTFQQAVQGNFK